MINLYYNVQGSDTRAGTQKNPVGFLGKPTLKNPAQNNQILYVIFHSNKEIFYWVDRCKRLRNKFSELLNITEIKDHYWSAAACR